jgi:hypothetical protein
MKGRTSKRSFLPKYIFFVFRPDDGQTLTLFQKMNPQFQMEILVPQLDLKSCEENYVLQSKTKKLNFELSN